MDTGRRESVEQQTADLRAQLQSAAAAHWGCPVRIEDLRKISAGASREVWAFEAAVPDAAALQLIVKRDPIDPATLRGVRGVDAFAGIDRNTEGALIRLVGEAGVLAPRVHFFLPAGQAASPGFAMTRIEGETLGRHIVRDEAYSGARETLAYQCGQQLARIHAVPRGNLPALQELPAAAQIRFHRELLDRFGQPHPGFEYGLCWLEERLAIAGAGLTLVHGDFRNGNLVVGPDGLRSVLDWELAHRGNPLSDLGWLCIRSWRYGCDRKPVGGFGERDQLFAGYEAAGGGKVDAEAAHFWEVFGTLRWGMLCMMFAFTHLSGRYRSLEYAAIGRRAAETEYDLLNLLD